ncbi:MAG: MBL fold metallo-hydrolase [Deltaproteobacteria bacterium]|nr:MBL fold metallo-hydrolase [Deltaproteobacteria bacterium]
MSDGDINDTKNIDPSVGGTLFQRYFTGRHEASTVAPDTFFMTADYVNLAAFETPDGLLLVDTGMVAAGPRIFEEIRKRTQAPLHTVVYTHGHLDHAFGLRPWLEAGERPRVIAHENVVRRFRTYMKTAAMNIHINRVQFGIVQDITWPEKEQDFFWPDTIYRDQLTLQLGGERFELRHGKGETDDATWVWAPERGIVCSGDLWVGILPNCGNPQKVQRYPEEWADALEAIASLGAELLLPGHGHPIEGSDTIRTRCLNTAEALRAIVRQTLEGLNAGKMHEEILAAIRIPDRLAGEAYLDPLYDRPEFIARNVIREHGGWWNGFSAELLPAKMVDRASEIARLAGGASLLIARARDLIDADPALACHLAEWASLAAPEDPDAQQCVIDVFGKRAETEISLMGRGLLSHAVRKAEKALADLDRNR